MYSNFHMNMFNKTKYGPPPPQKGVDMYGGYKLHGGYGTYERQTSNNVNSLITKNTPYPNYTQILPTRDLSLDDKKDIISTNFRYSMFGRISGPYAGCASCPK